MSSATTIAAPRRPGAAHALQWCAQGLRLWRRSPLLLLPLSLIPLAAEFAMQQIPWAGVLLSKLLTPLLSAGLLLGVASLAAGERLRPHCVVAGLTPARLPRLLLLNVLMLCVFGTQVLVAWLVYGEAGLQAALFAQVSPALRTHAFVLTLILPGVIPSVLLLLAMPLLLFSGIDPLHACVGSLRFVLSAPTAFALYAAICATLLAAALIWGYGLGLLLLQPWILTSTYAAYCDLTRDADT